MNELQKYCDKRKKPDTKDSQLSDSIYMIARTGEFIETEDQWFPRAGGGSRDHCQVNIRRLFGEIEIL